MFGMDDAVAAVATLADSAVKRIWPDATEIEKAKLTQLTAEIQNNYNVVLGQLDINKSEALSPHWFVAAARPAAIWVGVFSLLYSGIGLSLLNWLASINHLPALPFIDSSTQENLLYALLGVGGLRTAEKLKGVDTRRIGK